MLTYLYMEEVADGVLISSRNCGTQQRLVMFVYICSLLNQKMKIFRVRFTERVILMTEKQIHKLRANVFYSFMEE